MATSCVHDWRINSANYGVCQKCGAGHQFLVYKAKFDKEERRRIERMCGLKGYSPNDDYFLTGIALDPSCEMTYKGGKYERDKKAKE